MMQRINCHKPDQQFGPRKIIEQDIDRYSKINEEYVA